MRDSQSDLTRFILLLHVGRWTSLMPKSDRTLSPSTTNPHPYTSKSKTHELTALQKKKNADAQAAFRTRRDNYIATLEETGVVPFPCFHRFRMLDMTCSHQPWICRAGVTRFLQRLMARCWGSPQRKRVFTLRVPRTWKDLENTLVSQESWSRGVTTDLTVCAQPVLLLIWLWLHFFVHKSDQRWDVNKEHLIDSGNGHDRRLNYSKGIFIKSNNISFIQSRARPWSPWRDCLDRMQTFLLACSELLQWLRFENSLSRQLRLHRLRSAIRF